MSTTGHRALRFCLMLLAGLLIAAAGTWGTLALLYSMPADSIVRLPLVTVFAAVSLLTLVALPFPNWRWRVLAAHALCFVVLLIWWRAIEPSNDRDWQTDVAVLPQATIEGDIVTVRNVRNFDYRSETDYTPAYYDGRYDLQKLEGVDLVAVYWMGPAIAHVFLSFAFEGGKHLAISIETRKERNEAYSTLKGFFRQYELYYVVGDERDLIRLRTNYRRDPPEDVHVYRMTGPIENGRRLFREYMARINALNTKPEFYNTLTTNCTTNIWLNSRVNPTHLPFSWKILASGYVPEFLHEHGRLRGSGESFSRLQQRAHVNERAQAADDAADFSQRIRESAPAERPSRASRTGPKE